MPGAVATPVSSRSLLQNDTVVGEMAHVDIDIEGAIGRRNSVKTEPRERLQQQIAVASVDANMPLQFVARIERRKACVLAERRRCEKHVSGEGADALHIFGRRQQPAEPPSDHAEVFRETADDKGPGIEAKHRLRGLT